MTRYDGMPSLKYVLLVIVLLSFLLLSSCVNNYSDGFRVGTINKFSHKGLIFVTWEGEMNLGGFRQGQDGAVANLWQFSIDGARERNEDVDALAAAITKAAESGKAVKVYYKQDICFCPDRGNTGYFVQKVEALP